MNHNDRPNPMYDVREKLGRDALDSVPMLLASLSTKLYADYCKNCKNSGAEPRSFLSMQSDILRRIRDNAGEEKWNPRNEFGTLDPNKYQSK